MTASRVLFDAPGPRARRRIKIATGAVLVLIAGGIYLAIARFADNGQLESDKWSFITQPDYINFLWDGLLGTLQATAMSAVLAFPFGALLALMRLARSRPLRLLATAYIEVFRSVPLLLLLFVFLTSLPRYGFNPSVFWKLVLPITMVNAAILAEVFRAGVRALDRGQSEAASAIGLSYWQAMRLIVLPQAVRLVLPTLVTQLISLLKDSTLGYVVSYPELMHQGESLTAYLHVLIQPYLIIAAVYVVINLALSRLAHAVEGVLNRRRRASGAEVEPEAVAPALT